jgi:hypothetical protein
MPSAITIEGPALIIDDESVRVEMALSMGCETTKTVLNNVVNMRCNCRKSRSASRGDVESRFKGCVKITELRNNGKSQY